MTKIEQYKQILKQLNALYDERLSGNANICQVLAHIKKELGLFWAGIYVCKGKKLYLDIFQGEPACTVISMSKGACGTAAEQQCVVNLADVSKVDNYIACHPETASEIVIPAIMNGKTLFVLDIDSTIPGAFDETDEKYLCSIAEHLIKMYS